MNYSRVGTHKCSPGTVDSIPRRVRAIKVHVCAKASVPHTVYASSAIPPSPKSKPDYHCLSSQDPFDAELQRVPFPWVFAVPQQRCRGAGPHPGWGCHHQTCPLKHPGTRVLLWGELHTEEKKTTNHKVQNNQRCRPDQWQWCEMKICVSM